MSSSCIYSVGIIHNSRNGIKENKKILAKTPKDQNSMNIILQKYLTEEIKKTYKTQ